MMMSNSSDNEINMPNWLRKVLLIVELVIVCFLSSFLPDLLTIGYPPTLEQLYKPIISALIVALYAYAKIRNISLEDE